MIAVLVLNKKNFLRTILILLILLLMQLSLNKVQCIIHFKSQNGCLRKLFLVVSHSSMSRNRNLTFILLNSFIII